jgi:hypothetical protein
MIQTALVIDGVGMSAVYISKTESLLKHTVAFQSIAKDMIPLKKNFAVSVSNLW